ncbi:glycerophosphoryl diester phosphodiesterase [Leadbetterella byssophila DSM 17132]|uniref:Glycerophosphoryl diester phosphodiesterase n=1 Tax=Leadbetterella byssophila (strain DSM 17132 / JCM 16389 / KACC 11308 / NBRC 106382 / 4M15) TaxID=649349 RepID=E4RW03_LEAB4|nr:glycerophosphodiester phosphodiesterase family protein [Leadbetterella byssophila]ADQ16146.1 glycerophosphoryl diester phosphodiesterase [Leadbetterella byssophila DSM 17132]
MRKIFLLGLLLWCSNTYAQKHKLHFRTFDDIKKYFSYEPGKKIISGHRGTHIAKYPENSIEGFQHVLNHTPAFFEIDPRLTKDSVIVLMHDATLDRTTTGSGKVSDFTWAELQKLYLKDGEGNVTKYKIPTLEQAMDWAKGKTVLNLDKKDVPLERIAALIKRKKAERYMMVTVHTAEQALFYHQQVPELMMSAFVKTEEALKSYENAGVPWNKMIAYIGSDMKPDNQKMYELLHARGVSCMISAAPKYDKLKTLEERAEAYRAIFSEGADVLESDLPIEVSRAIRK